ncbi:MAG: flavin reductase family protein [Sedimentisphaerales bacterium]|nr:flavin reductase family protein [Sedimentisphaerales bacterium]
MKQSLGPQTLLAPTPVWLVGTYDAQGKANLTTIAWGGICCSDPPCVTISLQRPRHAYDAIIERKAFTVNVPSADYVKPTDYCGIYSGKDHDKLAETGFTVAKSQLVDAPCVDQCPLIAECKLLQTIELGRHTMFVGQIIDIKAAESVLDESGKIDPAKLNPICFNPGNRSYNSLSPSIGQAFSMGKQL